MQNQKNFILFMVLSLLILVGGSWLQNKFLPQPERKKPEPPAERLTDNPALFADLNALSAAWAINAAHPGVATLPKMAGDLYLADYAAKKRPEILARKTEPKKKPPQEAPVVQGPVLPTRTFTLGDEKSNLRFDITSHGGTVQNLVLNKFKGADANGLPLETPENLIPESANLQTPSYGLYHYDPRHEDPDERPLATLGNVEWSYNAKESVKKTIDDSGNIIEYQLTLTFDGLPDVSISKIYTLRPGDYHIGLAVRIKKKAAVGDKRLRFRYQLMSGHGLPIEGSWYTTTLRNALIGREDKGRHIWREFEDSRHIASRLGGDLVETKKGDRFIRYAGVAVQYFASMIVVDDKQDGGPQDFLARARPTLEQSTMKGRIRSIAPDRAEFVLAGNDRVDHTFRLGKDVPMPKEADDVNVVWSGDSDKPVADRILSGEHLHDLVFDDIAVRVATDFIDLDKADAEVVHRYMLYNGPVKVKLLNQWASEPPVSSELVDYYLNDLHLDTLTDYHSPSGFGTFASKIYLTDVIIFVTNVMHNVLWFLHEYISPWSYGLCIMLLTFIVRGMMFPISRKQALTSLRMQELQPELKKLQEKYKNDPQAKAAAQMELWRKHGVNPFGTCWVVMLQMPIFLGLYYALQESIHFRLANFLWIKNLAAPDMLVYWGTWIPWLSRPEDYGGFLFLGPYFNILPVIAVCFMIYQQVRMMPPPTDEQTAMQQKMMKYMTAFFAIFFYKVAAGLCIYFITSSIWGLTERKLLPKKSTASRRRLNEGRA